MGFLSKINKKLGFSKGTKERVRALKRREALGLNPKYVEDPYGPILNRPSRVPFDGQINEAALQARAPRMPRIDDGRMRAMPIGPGARLQMPNFGMEQMPIARRDPSALERLPMGNMPDFSQIDMSQLDLSGIPQSISQMNLPQMPEGLPSIEEIQGNQRMPQMDRGRMQPRMMMAEGDEVFMPSNPNQIAFSIETEIKNLMNEYEMAANNGEIERAQRVAEQINELEARRIQAMNEAKAMESGRTISDMDRQQTGRTISDLGRGRTISDLDRGRTISDLDRGRTISDMDRQIGMMYGGEMKRYANGGEIEAMLGGMDSGEQEAMGELEQMAPEMEMIDQLVMMVAQMIQQGAGEEQVISFLREQGLDDEDIGTVLQLVSEMAETEDASMASQNEIGADLEQLG
jgi:hypothetical protein